MHAKCRPNEWLSRLGGPPTIRGVPESIAPNDAGTFCAPLGLSFNPSSQLVMRPTSFFTRCCPGSLGALGSFGSFFGFGSLAPFFDAARSSPLFGSDGSDLDRPNGNQLFLGAASSSSSTADFDLRAAGSGTDALAAIGFDDDGFGELTSVSASFANSAVLDFQN